MTKGNTHPIHPTTALRALSKTPVSAVLRLRPFHLSTLARPFNSQLMITPLLSVFLFSVVFFLCFCSAVFCFSVSKNRTPAVASKNFLDLV